MSVEQDAMRAYAGVTGGDTDPNNNPTLYEAIFHLIQSGGLAPGSIAVMDASTIMAADRSLTQTNTQTGSRFASSGNGSEGDNAAPAQFGTGGSAGGGPALGAEEEYIAKALKDGNAFTDASGKVHINDLALKKELIFAKDANGKYYLDTKSSEKMTPGEAASVGLGYARIAADQAAEAEKNRITVQENDKNRALTTSEGDKNRFLTTSEGDKNRFVTVDQGDKNRASDDARAKATLDEGRRQFDKNYERSAFNSDRDYTFAREKYANDMLQHEYEFGAQYDQQERANKEQHDATGTRFALDAESLAANVASDQRKAVSEEKAATREILRNPSDYIARAFESRGAVSPDGRISHADLINELSKGYFDVSQRQTAAVDAARAAATKFSQPYVPTALAPRPVFTPSTPRFAPSAPAPVAAAPAAPAAPANTGSSGPGGPAGGSLTVDPNTGMASWVPKAEQGGRFDQNVVLTGDSSDGSRTRSTSSTSRTTAA
jgi:hypothetical protein